MQPKRKGPGRPPKSSKGAKEEQHWFRSHSDLLAELEKAMKESGRSKSEEIEYWLQQWQQIRQLVPGIVDSGDIKQFGLSVQLLKKELAALGEDPAAWQEYVHCVDFAGNLTHELVRERICQKVRDAFFKKQRECEAYKRQFGDDPEAEHLRPRNRPADYDPAVHRWTLKWLLRVDARAAERELAALKRRWKAAEITDQEYGREAARLRGRISRPANFEAAEMD